MANEQQLKQLEQDFQTVMHDNNRLYEFLRQEADESKLKEMIRGAYGEEHFYIPDRMDEFKDLNFEMVFSFRQAPETYAEQYLSLLKDNEQDKNISYTDDDLRHFLIIGMPLDMSMQIVIHDDLQEFMNEHYDLSQFRERVEQEFDVNEVKQELQESTTHRSDYEGVTQTIIEKMHEEGFPDTVDLDEIEVSIENIKPKSFDLIASTLFVEAGSTLDHYFSKFYIRDLVQYDLVEYDVNILTDVNDVKDGIEDYIENFDFTNIKSDVVDGFEYEMIEMVEQRYPEEIKEIQREFIKEYVSSNHSGVDENEVIDAVLRDTQSFFSYKVQAPSNYSAFTEFMKGLAFDVGATSDNDLLNKIDTTGVLSEFVYDGLIIPSKQAESDKYAVVIEFKDDAVTEMIYEYEDF